MSDSDQIVDNEDFEVDLGDIETETETPEVEIKQEETEESEVVEEKVPAKKSGYVEFTTQEQKDRVAEITRKRHDAERKAKALEQELAQYKKPPEPPREVPVPTADPIVDSDLYASQLKAREEYIRNHTKYEQENELRTKQSAAQEQARTQSLVETYDKNIARLGIDRTILQQATNELAARNINKELVEFLLEDDDGPALVAHLYANLDEAEDVLSMTPTKAVAYIERQMRSKLKPKPTSKAPPPPTKVSSTRSSVTADDGTTYE